MASVAPRSMPAGLSQMIQSNFSRRPLMTRSTPSSVRLSLSRVCEAGSRYRVSMRLSRMSACSSFASPLITLIRSNTTRRSAPMIRSRLRRPTSKSIMATFWPLCASAAPSAAVDVVFPTPPLPDVTTSTLAIVALLSRLIQRGDSHDLALQPGLRRPVAKRGVDFFRGLVVAIDGEQLRLDFLAVDPRGRIAVDSGHRPAAQRSVDVDRPAGDDLRAGSDRTQHGDVAFGKDDRLARAHRSFEQQRVDLRLGFALFERLGPRDHAGASAAQQRRHVRLEPIGFHTLDAEHANVALYETADEVSDRRPGEVDAGQVEHDRLSDEEAGRTCKRCVDLLQPPHDRNDGSKDERDVRTTAQPHLLTHWF